MTTVHLGWTAAEKERVSLGWGAELAAPAPPAPPMQRDAPRVHVVYVDRCECEPLTAEERGLLSML